MDTQSNLSAQLNQQQASAKMAKKAGGKLVKKGLEKGGAAAGSAVAGPAGAVVGKIVGGAAGKLAGGAIGKLVGDMNLLPWLVAIALDSYGAIDPYITTLTLGFSELIEVPFDIGGGFASKELLKSHLSQAPELNKWIWIVTGLKLIPLIDLFPWWITLMIYASYKIKQAKERAQAEQEAEQKQAQMAQRRQAEWATVAAAG